MAKPWRREAEAAQQVRRARQTDLGKAMNRTDESCDDHDEQVQPHTCHSTTDGMVWRRDNDRTRMRQWTHSKYSITKMSETNDIFQGDKDERKYRQEFSFQASRLKHIGAIAKS
eukprot:7404206-Heterocapsa_arctica.AAC.1